MRGRHSEIIVKGDKVVKRFRNNLNYNFWKEARMLNSLQPFTFVPRLHSIKPESLEIEMEYVRGKHISEVLDSIDQIAVGRILDVCRTLDLLGIQKGEMNHPDRHIILSERIVFVDFERSVFKNRPSNLTQFSVYLNSKLELMDEGELKKLLRYYKAEFSDEAYVAVRKRLLKSLE